MGMLLTGNRISAQEAQTHGLVNEVVAADDLDAAVDRWIAQILKCAPLSVKAIKESVKETSDLSIDEAQSKRLPSLIAALESEDADEGPRAFREKRAPNWKGR
jgi:crotonobetainyl-CoA hydratase